MASTAEKCVSIAVGLLRRGRLLGWFAENAATTIAQTSPLLAHAGGNTLHTRNFRRTKSKNIAGAKPALIVLCKCVTHGRQHCQTESQTRYGREITNCEQSNWHSRPLDRPTLRSSARRVARLGINLLSYRRECRSFKILNHHCTEILYRRPQRNRLSPVWNQQLFAPAVSPGRRRNGPPTMAEPIAIGPSPSGSTLPSRLQRLAIVVVMRERMIGEAKLIGREHGST